MLHKHKQMRPTLKICLKGIDIRVIETSHAPEGLKTRYDGIHYSLISIMSQSDPNRIVRQIPLVVGGFCGTLLLINRMTTLDLTTTQSRSDALGIFMSAILILCGLLWQKIQPRLPESVSLTGESGMEMASDLPESLQTELAWASHSLLANTPAKTLVMYYSDRTLLRRGILGGKPQLTLGTITERVLKNQKAVYLVDLKLYPGRVEFDYLPENTQGLICQPLGEKGVLIVGANAPRSFTQQDEDWITAIADKLSHQIERLDCIPSVSRATESSTIRAQFDHRSKLKPCLCIG